VGPRSWITGGLNVQNARRRRKATDARSNFLLMPVLRAAVNTEGKVGGTAGGSQGGGVEQIGPDYGRFDAHA